MMEYKGRSMDYLEDYIKENYEVYDRFTFDYLFRNLLQDGYDHEEAKDIIVHNCALSTLVMQERIYNGYYLKISVNEVISNDLLDLMDEIFDKYFRNRVPAESHYYPSNHYRGLNKTHSVDATSELIRGCSPRAFEAWEDYRFKSTKRKKRKTIYGQLQKTLGVKIHPAPDRWDRTYNVDFYIEVNGKYIGLQIKPISSGMALDHYQWDEIQEITHKKFTDKFGGKVFFVFSIRVGKRKEIHNTEVISEIQDEIKRLQD